MKKRILCCMGLVLGSSLLLGTQTVDAASAKISVSSNKKSVYVGDTVSVTYKISSSVAIGAWNYQITTPSNFSFVSCNNGLLTHQVGQVLNNSTKSTSVTCKFKAKSTGKGNFGVKNYQVEDFNVNTMATTAGTTSVSVVKPTTSNSSNSTSNKNDNKIYSSNNYLKSLSIDDFKLNPSFKKDTTNYSVELPADTTEINIKTTKEDNKASVSGDGKVTLEEGANKINIKVTAENGSVKTYTINATVKEKEPIKVMVGDEELTVVRKKENLKAPNNLYKETTLSINNEEVPAFHSDITKYTLVGLKDANGNINLYIYNEKDKSYTLYKELTFKSIILYITNGDNEVPSDYKKTTVTINNEKVVAYKSTKNNSFYLIYGMNIETGATGLYQYDEEEGTLQRFIVNKDVKEENTNDTMYLYTIIGLGGFLSLTYIVILINLIKRSSNKKDKIQKKETK